jgi:hypothetical protein
LIQSEIDRRRELAQTTDPLRNRQEELRRDQARSENHVERLVTAYQEGLVTLAQLRQRMPDLQKHAQTAASELQSLDMAAVDETRYLQLAETLSGFRSKLSARAEILDANDASRSYDCLLKRSSLPILSTSVTRSPFLPVSLVQAALLHRTATLLDRPILSVIVCFRRVLSPLLWNIVPDEFDWELERRGLRFARYADDSNIYVRTRRVGNE